MRQRVVLAHVATDVGVARTLVDRLGRQGFEAICQDQILVGDSPIEVMTGLLAKGVPVVVFGSARALGTGWCQRIVNAARNTTARVYVVRVEQDADVETLALGTKVAEYWRDGESSLADVERALLNRYPGGASLAEAAPTARPDAPATTLAGSAAVPGTASMPTPTDRSVPATIPAVRRERSILLVKPAIRHPVKDFDFGVALGLWVIKSHLRRVGIPCEILDQRLDLVRGSPRDFAHAVAPHDVVGFSACTCELPPVLQMARIAKDLGKTTILGGILTRTNEAALLENEVFDYVIPGVGTRPLAELLRAIRSAPNPLAVSHLRGVYSRTGGAPADQGPWMPDTLPSIDFATLDDMLRQYSPYLGGKLDVITSRGCHHRCRFCAIQKEQHTICHRNAAEVVDEIVYAVTNGVRRISIKDEIFPALLARANAILRESWLRTRSLGQPLEFKIKSRVDTLWQHKELIRQYYKWGVREIQLGVETTSAELLSIIEKGYGGPTERLTTLLDSLTAMDIVVNMSLLLGIRGESARYYDNLVGFVRGLRNLERYKVYVNFYTPHPFRGSWDVPDDSMLLSSDLNRFTHKIPVLAPADARTRKGRQAMLDAYAGIVEVTASEKYNPPVPQDLAEQFLSETSSHSGRSWAT